MVVYFSCPFGSSIALPLECLRSKYIFHIPISVGGCVSAVTFSTGTGGTLAGKEHWMIIHVQGVFQVWWRGEITIYDTIHVAV